MKPSEVEDGGARGLVRSAVEGRREVDGADIGDGWAEEQTIEGGQAHRSPYGTVQYRMLPFPIPSPSAK